MLKIQVLTLFPEMIEGAVQYGLLGQALQKKLLSLETVNPRDFTSDRHRSVDDRPFGGGDGMVMLPEVLEKTLQSVASAQAHVVYLSPQGRSFHSEKARELSQKENLILICGRYGGIDQRIINQYVDEEISIGDYVLSGGEVAALAVTEAVSRFIPGVLGHEDSAEKDSFADGLLEHPAFTKPREYHAEEVPAVLLSGNHAVIEDWKRKVSLLVTFKKRPDLFARYISFHNEAPSRKKKSLLAEVKEFYKDLSTGDRRVLALENLEIEDFHV
jgi:tRNA (guanine37-N1)-methyltransferase